MEETRKTLLDENWKVRTTVCWGQRDRWLSYDGVEDFLKNSKHKLIELPMVETLLFSRKAQNSFLLGEEAAAYFVPFTFASTILIYKCFLINHYWYKVPSLPSFFFSWTSNLQFVVLLKNRKTCREHCRIAALLPFFLCEVSSISV